MSVTSQHGDSFGAIVDYRPSYNVEGESLKKPAHSFETVDEDFIDLIKQVNNE